MGRAAGGAPALAWTDAANTPWNVPDATRGRPGRGNKAYGWRARRSGSSPRPPPWQRAAVLQALHLLLEKLFIHGHFSQLLLQPGDLQVSGVLGAFLQHRSSGAEKLFPP